MPTLLSFLSKTKNNRRRKSPPISKPKNNQWREAPLIIFGFNVIYRHFFAKWY
ncbi:hypothetical protein APA_1910 [Pseudanabaena sp. lw0831]|nr:hypothetical protein APA_1910 [Pseudanabaena sp. lw0831]